MMITLGESPIDAPEEHQERIWNTLFRVDDVLIMASDDLPPDNVVTAGNNFALFLRFSDLDELRAVYNKLSEDGQIFTPLESRYCMFADKFGIQWMLVNE